jgi:hypothetical protein
MNERIEELFGQALDQAVPETWTMLTPVQLSKLKDRFAELIVQECCDVAVKFHLAHPYSVEYQIKKHFGVEE